MEHEKDRRVDTFGFGVDKHEDQKRGFALAEIDRKDPFNSAQPLKEIVPVAVVAKDFAPLDASHDDMVQCSRCV